MKKIVLIVIMMMMLTGCTATYEVNIDGENITEKITVDGKTIKDSIKQIILTNPLPASTKTASYWGTDSSFRIEPGMMKKQPGVSYYDIRKSEDNLIFTGKFDLKNYEESRFVNMAYNGINVNNYYEYQSYYAFDGIKVFNEYPELTNVTVKITVNQKVLETDADKVEGNTYYWNLTKDNSDKTVYIKLQGIELEKQEKNTKLNKYTVYILFGALIILGVAGVYIYKKRQSNNKI